MLALVAPSILFMALFFVAPLGLFLFRSVDNSEVPGWLPRTVAALSSWKGAGLPEEPAFRALAEDLAALSGSTALPLLGRRLNHDVPGFRTLITATGNRVDPARPGSMREQIIGIDPRWGEPLYWQTIRRERHALTWFYLLSALDLRYGAAGGLERAPAESAIFLDLFGRTLGISGVVTLICVLLGFPVAATMAGSLVFGIVNHFVIVSPDHVSHVAAEWRTLFGTTAALLVATELAGVVAGVAVALTSARRAVP